MDKKILSSLLMIGILAAVMGGATYAVFSDTETSVDNTMTAGTIDFSVDGENPWTSTSWSIDLNDMKPCVVHYGEFNITNVGMNPMNLWKKINITDQNGGDVSYAGASSEPEYVEGGGEFFECEGQDAYPTGVGYDERCNLAAYTIYDMNVTIDNGPEETIIDHANQVRMDNINTVWIYLGELPAGQSMIVNQSYHLSSWDDASEPEVTNWAQGDVMTFDVELYGEQVTGTGPNADIMMLEMVSKDTTTWDVIPGVNGTLFYNTAGPEFVYDFTGVGLDGNTNYSLIYYADPWKGGNPGALIGTGTSTTGGALGMAGIIDLSMDLPDPADANYPGGAKIWLVPSSDYDAGDTKMIGWSPSTYLFETNLIQYDDTEV